MRAYRAAQNDLSILNKMHTKHFPSTHSTHLRLISLSQLAVDRVVECGTGPANIFKDELSSQLLASIIYQPGTD